MNSSNNKLHIFISYLRDDYLKAGEIRKYLMDNGETVWWDKDIPAGSDWKSEIRKALHQAYAFVVCLSNELSEKTTSGVYPEIYDAIGIFREIKPGAIYIIPVRLSECLIPDIEIDSIRTLSRIQYIDLFDPATYVENLKKLLSSIRSSQFHPLALSIVRNNTPKPLSIYDKLRELSHEQILQQFSISYFYLKHNRSQYINRAVEEDVLKWLYDRDILKSSPGFLILAPAGSGKTNLFCELAAESSKHRPTFLYAGPLIKIHEPLGLWTELREIFAEIAFFPSDRQSVKNAIREVIQKSNKTIAIFFDAVNEYHDPIKPKNEFSIFMYEAREAGLSVVLSCRDYYWGLFEGTWWADILKAEKNGVKQNRRTLGNYTYDEAKLAFDIYFKNYKVSAKPEGNAIEQFRHPLLLRFFCETYAGNQFGILRDIRLKNLFDSYWRIKLDSIAERMISQGEFGTAQALYSFIGSCILNIAKFMLTNNNRTIPSITAKQLSHSDNTVANLKTVYGRILDEHIILEEFSGSGFESSVVAFVFEEFMEYSMARAIVNENQNSDLSHILQIVVGLTEKYVEFNQIFGVVLYISLMLKEERNLDLWQALIGLGEIWEKVVIEAFKKLPENQIDDAVFDAVISLLKAKSKNVRIEALELLKYGRLKRIPTDELMLAVGNLVAHNNLAIRRRALIALTSFPATFSVPFIEKSVQNNMGRLTDQYVVVASAIKALAKLSTDDSLLRMARISGGFWHGDFKSHEIVSILGASIDRLLPLLSHQELLVRLGAYSIFKHASSVKAETILKDKLAQENYCKKTLSKADFPAWVNLGDFHFFNNPLSAEFEKDAIKRALNSMQEKIKTRETEEFCREKLNEAIRNKKYDDIPFNLEVLRNQYSHTQLIIDTIKAGLNGRSENKWNVIRGPISDLTIKPAKSRLVNKKMPDYVFEELKQLLGLDEYVYRYDEGITVRMGLNTHNYWKEYIYRAWGKVPKIYGHSDSWD